MSGVKSTIPEMIERGVELGFANLASPQRYFVVVVGIRRAPKYTQPQSQSWLWLLKESNVNTQTQTRSQSLIHGKLEYCWLPPLKFDPKTFKEE